MNSSDEIRLFMEPRSIAIVGASRGTGQGSLNMVEHLLYFGFQGAIYPVNPKAKEVLGIPCYSAVKHIPEAADLAVVITPRLLTVDAVRSCAEKGIKAIIVIGQGFADGDEEGKRMQEQMVTIARERGARLIGPNTLGIVNFFHKLNASLVQFHPEEPAPVAIISQTGVVCLRYPRFMSMGKVFDIGNVADINFTEILEYLEDDPQTKVILIYTEGLKEGRKFLEVARRVTRKKPILVMKAGRSEVGRKAAASHTGTLTGEDQIYEAAFKQAGIIRVKTIEEFHDYAKALLWLPPMRGNRVGIVTTSGAGGILASDACEEAGLAVAVLSEKVTQTLEKVYPDWMAVGNPCDIWPGASIMRHGLDNVYRMTVEAMVKDASIDAIICICIAVSYGWGHFNIPALVKEVARKSDKPIVSWFFGPDMERDASVAEEERNVAAYPSAERGVRALAAVRSYSAITQREIAGIQSATIAHQAIKSLISALKANEKMILGKEALEIMRSCNIPIAGYGIAHDREEAIAVSNRIGYPVVMKALSPAIVHKTEAGGVKLDVRNDDESAAAFEELRNKGGKEGGALPVLVQAMVQGGKEVILGMKRDGQFGPVLMFGMGGIYTEVFKDVSFRIAPINRDDALNMISEAKSYELLKGVRGETPSDIGAIVDALSGLSQLALDFPEIEEIDLNPFMVLESGRGGMGVDARISIRQSGQ